MVYNEAIGEIRVSAHSLGENKLYQQLFGRHFFGDENFLPGTGKYTLEPLKSDCEAAMVCTDVEGLEWVLL